MSLNAVVQHLTPTTGQRSAA